MATRGNAIQIVIEALKEELQDLKYGAVELTVHDGKVVQIDITRKTRLSK